MAEPTPQQLAKAREFAGPCEGSAPLSPEEWVRCGEGAICDACSLVPRVAALLAEVMAPLVAAISALDLIKETCEHVLKCKQCHLDADRVLSVVKAGLNAD